VRTEGISILAAVALHAAVLLGGRLLREAVLQQSSLSANDAYCAPAKQEALLALALDIHERCLELVAAGVPVARIEALDLSPATRARDATGPAAADEVAALARELLARLGELAP